MKKDLVDIWCKVLAILLILLVVVGTSVFAYFMIHEEKPVKTERVDLSNLTVDDIPYTQPLPREAVEEGPLEEESVTYTIDEPDEEVYYYDPEPEPEPEIDVSNDPSDDWHGDINGHPAKIDFMYRGVIYDGQYRYTWYSSNIARHYRISEWYTDNEGYWRTSDGYLVVASSDYEIGTILNTDIFGRMMVLDSGCASGTIDVYVNW